ncbi:MAG: S1 family peptidase, partial [Phycisphaerales bacterium]
SASAGVIRHDVDDALYRQLGQEPQFGAVGALNINFSNGGSTSCSGTLIADQWILTAAHCVDRPISSTIFANSSAFGFVDQVVVNPEWQTNGFLNGGDLALLHLSSPVTSIQAAQIHTQGQELGAQGTIVGFGQTGTGIGGAIPGSEGTLRAGNNIIDVLGTARGWDAGILLTDFDNPLNPNDSNYGSSSPLDLEYSIGPGDSGGALFIETATGWELAGISSFINSTDGNPNGDYGDSNGFTRVSDYTGWINSVIPTPGTLPMLATGLILGARRRRA